MKKISIVVRFRQEWPILASTMYSLMEDAEASGLAYEFVMVDNFSDDHAADVLDDKFRRWTRAGLLKVVRYDEKPSTWCAINAGWAQATGDVLVVADAHISVKRGTLKALVGGALDHGGIWHPAVQLWGDNEEQVNGFGYDLRLSERFWGNPCRHLPPGRTRGEFWKVPMAGACLYAVRRDEVERFGLYHPAFRAYGGGEPYLDLKWWLRGSAVWCHSGALCRHAFGLKAEWRTDKEGAKPHRNDVYLQDGRLTKAPGPGEEYLSYRAGYTAPSSFDFAFNFALAAFLLGGPFWCTYTAERLAGKQSEAVQQAIIAESQPEFEIGQLDDLIKRAPWESCDVHQKEKGLEP